jgi:flavin reductase (DIM6/NTAB) family NADH-FMN oxidoreductase RutF
MYWQADQVPRETNAKLWARLIAPRPIALISTQDVNGLPNIAPYSSLALVANFPPILSISFGRHANSEKRTLSNIKSTGVLTVNLVPRFLADLMNQSAENVEDQDDFTRLGLTSVSGNNVSCARIGECPASLECRLLRIHDLSPSQCELVLAQVVGVAIRDEFLLESEGFDPLAADLLASVGAEDYISVNGETLTLPRTWD